MLCHLEPNLAQLSLPDTVDGCLTDPLFWFGIGGPATVVLTLALACFWLDYKVRKIK